MTRLLRAGILFLALAGAGGLARGQNYGAPAKTDPDEAITAELILEAAEVAPGDGVLVAVRLVHAPGWHTYGKELKPGVVGKPTVLHWELPEGWTVEDLPWPPVHEVDSTDGKTSWGHEGTVLLPARLKAPADAAPGSGGAITVEVDALACDPTSCLPARAEAAATVTVAAATARLSENAEAIAAVETALREAKEDAGTAGSAVARRAMASPGAFAGYLLLAFIGGLILNVMPCVFPVLGIKVMSVVKQSGEEKSEVLKHGLAYTLGILVCFWALGLLVVSLGQAWGFQLQSPGMIYGLAAFFLVFGLNMAGVFEIGASAIGVGSELQARQGLGGSFFTGLLAVVVATPCSAPFLGTALGAAVALPPLPALAMFSMIGLGLAAPFLLLSAFPSMIRLLPRPGAWMESFKQGISFLLFGTVAYMIWVLTGMEDGLPLLMSLFGLVLAAVGCWVYGRWSLPHRPAKTRAIGVALGAAFLVGGLALGWPGREEDLDWLDWSPETVTALRAEGAPVYIDFTAKWCFTCQVNKRVYKSAALRALFKEKGVRALRADWTNDDPRITAALSELGKAAVPVNVFYLAGQDDPVIMDELLTEGALRQVLEGIK
jgi:thiol:disulfide interchange protein